MQIVAAFAYLYQYLSLALNFWYKKYPAPPKSIIGSSLIINPSLTPSIIKGSNKMPPIIRNGSNNTPPTNLNTKPRIVKISLKTREHTSPPAIKNKIVVSILFLSSR